MFSIYNFNYRCIKEWNVGIISFDPMKFRMCLMSNVIVFPRKWPIYSDQVTSKWFKKPFINVISIYDFKNKSEYAFNYRLHSKFHCKKVIHVCHAL